MKIYSKKIKDTKYKKILDFIPFYKEKSLYIDIETTGFMRERNMIYLIGLLYYDQGELTITQWLCEKEEDEYEMLFKLNQLVTNFEILIHFNGDSFDLPYIKARMALYRMKEVLSSLESFDFYKKIKPYKGVFQTDNFKLKTMEKLCGYDRVDPFTGGQLIGLYKEYLNGDAGLEYSFIIHNEEDMIGLYYLNALLPLLSLNEDYRDFYLERAVLGTGPSKVYHMPFKHKGNIFTFQLSHKGNSLKFKPEEICYETVVDAGEKRLFYENYSDYYYLPEEDSAVHHMVADFMPSKYRKKATPKTAYTRQEGLFIYLPGNKKLIWSLLGDSVYLFNDSYKDKYTYILTQDFEKHIEKLLPFTITAFVTKKSLDW